MAKSSEDTPMIRQFFAVKAQHPEALLLYRVGDFYETYSDDALLASKVLGLVLTKRSNGDRDPMPMAGFPHHAVETYLQKLVRAGYKVAICDQLEDPALVKGKALVKRGVTEILTPGIAFGEGMLEQKEHNYLAGLTFEDNVCGAAFLDASTGTFQLAQGSIEYISTLLAGFGPKEVLVQRDVLSAARQRWPEYYYSSIDEWAFVYDAAREKLCNQLGVNSLKGFAVEAFPQAIRSAGALIYYLEQTCHVGLKNICSVSRIDEAKFVWMDKFTFRNLEIFSSAGGDGVSLVDTIDRCCSPMGARLLRQWLSMPVLDTKELDARYDSVQFFHDNDGALEQAQMHIGEIGDLERTLSRAATGKIVPRETRQLARSLSRMNPLKDICAGSGVKALEKVAAGMKNCDAIQAKIENTLAAEPAAQIGKGEVIARGVDAKLDELRDISTGGKDYLLAMQQREIERTGISSLKISYNNVFGYYIEVRNTFRDQVPPDWIRKQTLVSAERYVTPELKDYEEKILGAEAGIYEIESRIYGELVAAIQSRIRDIQANCAAVSRLDVLQGFAQQAIDRNYCRPEVDSGTSLEIKAGRHPVIETLMKPGEEYVPNDISLDSKGDQIMILTGPNMAGKSALLRQTALIILMAQVGSWVPASSARFGYFDKIFTRVGASDNISRGESTFMVEMLETSMIMHNLSERSLVLLDEIGRGTSTYDGMSIARALVEYIHRYGKGAKTLFATHYHELNDLEEIYPRVKNFHIAVKEQGKEVIFLRKLTPGGVAHSFGIHVARLAGMPKEVIESAEKTLRDLERKEKSIKAVEKQGGVEEDGSVQLSFFQLDDPTLSSLREQLENADLNNMTPLQAFDLLRNMKKELGV